MDTLPAVLLVAAVVALLMWANEQRDNRVRAENELAARDYQERREREREHNEVVMVRFRAALRVIQDLLRDAELDGSDNDEPDLLRSGVVWCEADEELSALDRLMGTMPPHETIGSLVSFLPGTPGAGTPMRSSLEDFDSGRDRSWRPLLAERARLVSRHNAMADELNELCVRLGVDPAEHVASCRRLASGT